MPRTKKPRSDSAPAPTLDAAANGFPNDVLTLAEAAAYLRLNEADVVRLVEEQGLPARRLGKERRFLKSAIQQWLGNGMAVVPGKAAQLAIAGAWKDDPLVDDELRETLRRRGRSVTTESAPSGKRPMRHA